MEATEKLQEQRGPQTITCTKHKSRFLEKHGCMPIVKLQKKKKKKTKNTHTRIYPSIEDESDFTSIGSEFNSAPCK